jgi:hypothetical protein
MGTFSQAAQTLFLRLGRFSYHEVSVVMSIQVTHLDIPAPPHTMLQKYTVHDSELIPLRWLTAPTGRNRVPNMVLQPLILARVPWTRWTFPKSDISDYTRLITTIIWQYPREDLFTASNRIKWWDGPQHRNIPRRKSLQGSRHRSVLKGR